MKEELFHLGVKALIRNSDGKFLLLKINREKLKKIDGWDGEVYWDIPGGRIQRGARVEETIRREIEEETGIVSVSNIVPFWMGISNINIPIHDTPGIDRVGLVLSVYQCELVGPGVIALSDEHTESEWFAPKEAGKLLAFKYPREFCDLFSKLDVEGLPKLVRDNIPELIIRDGRTPRFHTADGEEYVRELGRKLHEELYELEHEQKAEDLFDIVEIVHELASLWGISADEFERQRKEKTNQNGGFSKRIILDSNGK